MTRDTPNWVAWYQEAYLRLKIQDEVYRSLRYEVPLSVVVAQFPVFGRRTARTFHEFVSNQLRRLDFAGAFGDGLYALTLPHTPREGADVVAQRLEEAFPQSKPLVGVASIPEDGDCLTVDLLEIATRYALETTAGPEPRFLHPELQRIERISQTRGEQ